MTKIAIYPGTFDPITFGHIDVIKKSLKLFDKIVVGVSDESNKNYLFSSDERIEIVNKALFKDLKLNKKCDLVICLSHLGFSYSKDSNLMCDMILAKKTSNIDLIIGGHTHTFLEKPVRVKNIDNKDVIINQVGCFGINLGKIDFYFSNENKKNDSESIKI